MSGCPDRDTGCPSSSRNSTCRDNFSRNANSSRSRRHGNGQLLFVCPSFRPCTYLVWEGPARVWVSGHVYHMCVYVCMYVYIYIYIYIYIIFIIVSARVHARALYRHLVQIFWSRFWYMSVFVNLRVRQWIFLRSIHSFIHACTCKKEYRSAYMYAHGWHLWHCACACVDADVCVWVCVCVSVYMRVSLYVCNCMHLYVCVCLCVRMYV
jgi:hypothetical protein